MSIIYLFSFLPSLSASSFYTVNAVHKFQYSRPLRKGEGDKDNEFAVSGFHLLLLLSATFTPEVFPKLKTKASLFQSDSSETLKSPKLQALHQAFSLLFAAPHIKPRLCCIQRRSFQKEFLLPFHHITKGRPCCKHRKVNNREKKKRLINLHQHLADSWRQKSNQCPL